jgi:5-methylcytosine-specific restriction endonuclease McrA
MNRFRQQTKTVHKLPSLKTTFRDKLYAKYSAFVRKKHTMNTKLNFTVDDIITKIGENPTCYLTGDPIDISKTNSYNFDHVIPTSRGGTNDLDNLGILTKAANQAKSDMTPDEFLNFCKKVLEHNGFSVAKL